jgi:integrase/recombinase XerC
MNAAPPDPDTALLPESAEQFLDAMATGRRLAQRTVAMYRLALRELAAATGASRMESLAPAQIRRTVGLLQSRGQAPRSIAIALAAWRGYYRWLARHHGLAANPVDGMRAPKAKKLLPKALPPDEAVRLVEFIPDTAVGKRDHAMFELMYSSGLRLAELIGLDLQPVRCSLCWLADDLREVTVTGKGSKRRTVPVGSKAALALRAWIEVRHELARDVGETGAAQGGQPLFVGARGARITPMAVQRALKACALRQGLPGQVHPHVLRHSFASHVLQSSGDLRAVQEMLGHASISSTQVYTRLDFQHLAKVYDQAHPRAKQPSGKK